MCEIKCIYVYLSPLIYYYIYISLLINSVCENQFLVCMFNLSHIGLLNSSNLRDGPLDIRGEGGGEEILEKNNEYSLGGKKIMKILFKKK